MTSDETTVTRPWDDATVAQFRSDHVTNHGWTCVYGGGPDCPIARWIATLDAALRSGSGTSEAPDEDTAQAWMEGYNVGLHGPWPTGPTDRDGNPLPAPTSGDADPLREALTFLRKRLVGTPPNVDAEDAWFASLLDQAEAIGRAALAAPPSPVGLDFAPPLPILDCECGACVYLRRKQDEYRASRLSSTGGEP